jgi:hypothetical protein
MSDFQEKPRTLAEILEAEKEFFDRCWYEYSRFLTDRYEAGERDGTTEDQYKVSKDAQARVLARRPDLRPAETDVSGACGTASCPRCAGFLAASGTSSTPELSSAMTSRSRPCHHHRGVICPRQGRTERSLRRA